MRGNMKNITTTKVTLDNVTYNIDLVNKLNKDLDGNRGIIFYEELKILLDKNLPSERLIQTFYHELSHAICEQTSFNTMLEEKLGDNGYEIFIDNMGKVLYSLLHQNNIQEVETQILNNV